MTKKRKNKAQVNTNLKNKAWLSLSEAAVQYQVEPHDIMKKSLQDQKWGPCLRMGGGGVMLFHVVWLEHAFAQGPEPAYYAR